MSLKYVPCTSDEEIKKENNTYINVIISMCKLPVSFQRAHFKKKIYIAYVESTLKMAG